MAKNHQLVQTKAQEKIVHIPINMEHDSTTLINQTGNSNQKSNHWPTIILCIVFVITGQSIDKILENFYYDQLQRMDYNSNRQNDGVWTQSLLQTVGFPLLLVPLYIFTTKKHNQQQPPITSSDPSTTRLVLSFSGCIGMLLAGHGSLSGKGKLDIPFRVFTLIYTTQLFFTPVFAAFINKTKFNRWIIISLILAIATGTLTSFSSSFGGKPDKTEESYAKGSWPALLSGVYFSLVLCTIENVFRRTESTTRKQSFSSVFLVVISSSFVATVISVVGLLIYGEKHDLKREMNEFLKGKGAYVMTMVVQAVSWQIYWVGIVGLVFSVSSVLSNVISVITSPIVSVLVVIFFNFMNDEFDVFKGVALITAALSAAAYLYRFHKENRN
ncbi:PREDICTED: probable purine permease 14 [Camelina sativa]|uniref:Probable purine permease n=1 Tax=Camelina sativa TaxID=90675 RepID=A0ABM0YB59_CAMSA|nr:PREDICTED: probable purine permease 14 [Camelina sativa]